VQRFDLAPVGATRGGRPGDVMDGDGWLKLWKEAEERPELEGATRRRRLAGILSA
jgi:hypothetical protein